MGKKRYKQMPRAEPANKRNNVGCGILQNWDTILCSGYSRLSDNPEVVAAVNKISDLVSGMAIHLMENSSNGDRRIKDELAKKIDIAPNKYMTRKTFIYAIVKNLLLNGNGNSVIYPETKNGLLENLFPVSPNSYSFIKDGFGYKININGIPYDPDDIIHVVINSGGENPWKGNGYKIELKGLVNNLKQAAETKRSFMESKWKPSVIVKVDGLVEEFSNKEGRRKILEKYVESSESGEPWLLPADQFDVNVIKPLSLQDLAINEAVQIDKRTVAAILDVPPFILGIGDFNEAEWNNFINTKIRSICNAIEQELTRKLLISPTRYFRFNFRSLLSYDIEKLSRVGNDCYTRGIVTGNEVRDWIGKTPLEGLDELVILENYIPQGMIGDQKKLTQGSGG